MTEWEQTSHEQRKNKQRTKEDFFAYGFNVIKKNMIWVRRVVCRYLRWVQYTVHNDGQLYCQCQPNRCFWYKKKKHFSIMFYWYANCCCKEALSLHIFLFLKLTWLLPGVYSTKSRLFAEPMKLVSGFEKEKKVWLKFTEMKTSNTSCPPSFGTWRFNVFLYIHFSSSFLCEKFPLYAYTICL